MQAQQEQIPLKDTSIAEIDPARQNEEFTFTEPPVIDMQAFFDRENNPDWEKECKKVAMSFHKFGICIIRDPRVKHEDNESYIDMVESYFE